MSSMHFYFDRQGLPIDVLTWAERYEDFPSRLLARAEVGAHEVITVWTGLNDDFVDPPTIFSSIVKTGSRYHHEIRTSTEDAAMLAHQHLVDWAELNQPS